MENRNSGVLARTEEEYHTLRVQQPCVAHCVVAATLQRSVARSWQSCGAFCIIAAILKDPLLEGSGPYLSNAAVDQTGEQKILCVRVCDGSEPVRVPGSPSGTQ